MFTAHFWVTAGQKAVKAFFHALAASLVATTTLAHLSWAPVLGTAGCMALLSLCNSVAEVPVDVLLAHRGAHDDDDEDGRDA